MTQTVQPPVDQATIKGQHAIYNELRRFRNEVADKRNLPLYIIATNDTFGALAYWQPKTLEDLKGIYGLGTWRIQHFGLAFLAIVAGADGVEIARNGPPQAVNYPTIGEYEASLRAEQNNRLDCAAQSVRSSDVTPTLQEAPVNHPSPINTNASSVKVSEILTSIASFVAAVKAGRRPSELELATASTYAPILPTLYSQLEAVVSSQSEELARLQVIQNRDRSTPTYMVGKVKFLAHPSIEAGVITITPEIALLILENARANRKSKHKSIVRIKEAMKNGNWAVNGETIIFNEKGELIEGLHRIKACIDSGVAFDTVAVFGVDDSVFATIDGGVVRKGCDIVDMMGVADSNYVAAVIRLLRQDELALSLSYFQSCPNYEIADILARHPDIGAAVRYVLSGPMVSKYGQHSDLAYAYYRAGLIDVEMRDEFFARLSSLELLSSTDPVTSVILKLAGALAKTNKAVRAQGTKHILALFIKSWNQYLRARFRGDRYVTKQLSFKETEAYPKWQDRTGQVHSIELPVPVPTATA